MELEEIKERYKSVPILGRLFGIAILAVLPAAYTWWDEGSVLEETLTEAQSKQESARTKFEANRKKKGNLPELEAKLEFTEVQLGKARKKLPDSYRIEDVLQKAATIAKETGVKLSLFKPGREARSGSDYKYFEMPINTEVTGKFSQVASFFDRVVHLDGTIFLRNIAVTAKPADADGEGGARKAKKGVREQLSEYEKARRARTELRVDSKFEIVIFRGMSEREQTIADNDGGAPLGEDPAAPKRKPPPPPPDEGAGDKPPKAADGGDNASVKGGEEGSLAGQSISTVTSDAAERRF